MGVLPRLYALDGAIYDGVLCHETEVFDKSDPSRAIHKKCYKNKGFGRTTVISALNERVQRKGGVERWWRWMG